MTKTETITIVSLMLLAGFIGVLGVLPTEAAGPKVLTEISSDTTWTAAGGPYYIEQDVHVATGAKLTIEAGASVYVNGSYYFYIDGTLSVQGTQASPVLMTSNFTSPSPGNWRYIQINTSGRLEMDNATISYLYGIYAEWAARVRIENCTMHNTSSVSIYLYDTDFPILKNLYLHHTQNDLVLMQYCNYANVSNIITYNTNYGGMRLEHCDYFVMHHIRIDRCNNEGIYLYDCDYSSLDNLTNTYGWGRGLYAGSCHYLKINAAMVSNIGWSWGLQFDSCDYLQVTNSSITQAPGWQTWYGMYMSYCRYATLKNNYFDMAEANLEIYAWSGEEYFNHTIANNYVRSEPILYYKETSVNLDNVNTKHLMLFKCTASIVKNTNIMNGDAIEFWYCNDITVDNCNVSNSYYGIRTISCDRVNIKSSSVYQESNGFAIETRWGTFINVTDCAFSNNNNGLLFRYNDRVRLENNSVSYSWDGILIESSTFSILKNNTIWGIRSRSLYFDCWSEDQYNNTVTQDNTVNGNPTYYYFKKGDITISHKNAGFIGAFYSRDIKIDNITIETTIQFHYTDNIDILDSHLDWNRPWGRLYCTGIYIQYGDQINITKINNSNLYANPINIGYCAYVNITKCQTYNTNAINTWQSSYVTISHCEFFSTEWSWMVLGDNNPFFNVSNNVFYMSRYGMYAYNCEDINVTYNEFYWMSSYYSLYLRYSDRGRIKGNEFFGGQSANAYLEYCTYLNITRNFFNYSYNYGLYLYECDQCLIYLNGFILNSDNAYDTRTTNNKWDNGTMGNLWSDYTGVDADHNGIGDTPYDVDGDTQDQYPLMDPFPPTIRCLSHANNSFVIPGDTIQFEVTDFNLNYTKFQNDTDPWADFSSPYQAGTDNWGQGPHDVYIYADDTMGNKITVWFHFKVDTIRPDIVMVSPGNDTMTSGTITLDFEVYDPNLAFVESSVDGAPFAPLGAPYDITTSPVWSEGLHTIRITAMDAAGNGRTSIFLITLDKTAPLIELVSPANQSAVEAGTPIDLSVSDANLGIVQYSQNGVNYTLLKAPFDVDTSTMSGTVRLHVRAFDKAGNKASAYYDFTISDTSVPQIVLFSPQDKAIIKPGVKLDFGVLDNALSSVRAKVNDLAYEALPAPFDIDTTGMPNGELTVTIQAVDLSGNTAEKTYTFFIDTQAPDVALLDPLDGKVNARSTIQFKVTENVAMASVYYTVNKWVLTPMPAGSAIPTTGFTDGMNTVDVIATDTAGNEGREAFEFEMDSISPMITLTSPAGGATIKQGTPVSFEVSDIHLAGVSSSIDGANGADLTAPYTIDTSAWADGWHTAVITANDSFGNTAILEVKLMIDLTPPTVVSTTPSDNATGVAIKPQIQVVFSEPMDTAVGGTISSSGGDSFTMRWSSSGTTLYLTPKEAMSYNTTYTLNLSALSDLFGNSLNPYSFSFKTGIAPPIPAADDDDDDTTTHPPLPKNDDQIERESTKASKNMFWITMIVIVLAGILVAFLLIKLRKKWTSEDKMADEALWRLKEKRRKARLAREAEAATPQTPKEQSPVDEGITEATEGEPMEEPPAEEGEELEQESSEDALPPPMDEDTDFKDADEFGSDEDLELDLPPPIEEEEQ